MKLNAEVDTATAARYRVLGYPTVLVLNEKGEEIDRVVGYYRAPEFMSQVEDYLAGRNTLASMIAEEPARKDDAEFVYKLGDRFADHGRFDEARIRLLRFVELDPKNRSGQSDDALYRLSRMARKDKDYATARKYAQAILDRFKGSDMMKPAFLQVGINLKKEGRLSKARAIFVDYFTRFPDDEDAPWAREQADTLAAQLARPAGA
ncbi:MAG: tetratricopeptide repeat protein [Candidatus Latescibacteria bacterium]|nr:tetratricopeptide repeat protein [Candidatus Latescibacterota bacterium]